MLIRRRKKSWKLWTLSEGWKRLSSTFTLSLAAKIWRSKTGCCKTKRILPQRKKLCWPKKSRKLLILIFIKARIMLRENVSADIVVKWKIDSRHANVVLHVGSKELIKQLMKSCECDVKRSNNEVENKEILLKKTWRRNLIKLRNF